MQPQNEQSVRVFTVCNSVYSLLWHNSMVKPFVCILKELEQIASINQTLFNKVLSRLLEWDID